MSFLTLPLVTSHSHCLICRERTLCAGCVPGRWREAPAQRKSWLGGRADSDLGKGHFPHQSLKRKQETLVTGELSKRTSNTLWEPTCDRHRKLLTLWKILAPQTALSGSCYYSLLSKGKRIPPKCSHSAEFHHQWTVKPDFKARSWPHSLSATWATLINLQEDPIAK